MGGARRRSPPASQGKAVLGPRGKRERELRGIDSLPHLGRRWRVAAWPRRPAAAGGGASGGGAAAEERGRGVAAWFEVVGVVLGGCSVASFIGGQGGGGGSGVLASGASLQAAFNGAGR